MKMQDAYFQLFLLRILGRLYWNTKKDDQLGDEYKLTTKNFGITEEYIKIYKRLYWRSI